MVATDLSVFTDVSRVSVDDSVLLDVLESRLRAAGVSDLWQVTTGGFWCAVVPHGPPPRPQGWKLHLSATPASAQAVLTRSLPTLLDGRCAFKFAATIEHVELLNGRHTSRGHSGKFITIYPDSDADAVRLAEELHQATATLVGPRILSDRPYASGSLVHYRYGAFTEARKMSNDGFYSWVVFDPEGNPVEDRRIAQYTPPAWAQCPFPEGDGASGRTTEASGANGGASGTNGDGAGVPIGDRFLAREAIRHTNKGGVYRAVDTHSGADVIIKEARPHVAADRHGRDTRDLLRAEAGALEEFEPLDVAPRLLALFEHSGHLFLAEDLVPGVPLREWVSERMHERGIRRDLAAVLEMADRLVDLLQIAHSAGFIIRDFNPNNIMVLPDGQLRFIDLELAVKAAEQQEEPTGMGTPGFGAPEQLAGAPPAVEADYFGLGATICFLVTGNPPFFVPDEPKVRPLRERLAEWLTVRAAVLDIPAELRELILGLMDDEPGRRSTPSDAKRVLATAQQPSPQARSRPRDDEHGGGRRSDERGKQAADDIVDHTLASMNPTDSEQLWPVPCTRGASDPCAVHLGAAGVLGVLTRCFELTGDQRLPEAIATAGHWITRRLRADPQRSPGLYFGEAGIAWSLYDAGRTLDDDRLAEQALTLADTLPVCSPNPDLTHGTAGLGLALLHLGNRTGDEAFVERAGRSADTLVTSVEEEPSGVSWATPAAFESRLAGGRYHGFAHGTAGVGHFLLAVALATGRPDCLDLACRAGDTLLANAAGADGVALWGSGPGDEPTAPYWCHGSAGIGGFLARLHHATGDDRFGNAARMAARAVVENSWRGVPLGQCHGLAGNGEFLLDMAECTGDQQYEAWADQLARLIFASRAHREGRTVFPDEDGGLSVTWAEGMSGVLAFLLRLQHRSPRLWAGDPVLERSGR